MNCDHSLPPLRRLLPRLAVMLSCLAGLALTTTPSVALEHAEVCRYCRAAATLADAGNGKSKVRRYAPDRQVDVQHIKLDVTPDFAHESVAGTATLKFAPIAKPLQSLRLDGINLRVKDVRSSHKVRDWSAGSEDVTIVFDEPIPVDEEAFVEIDYSAEPIEGLYFRTEAMGLKPGDVHCWTQGETHEARHWIPCFDYPNERATTEVICHVPADMTVVSNGKLVDETTSDDGKTKTFHWRQDKPHVSYLICFVAGHLEKIEGKHRDVPLAFYTQPSRAEYAENAFRDTADIMAFFEKEIGVDFPWDKYDQATIADFMWGGMENTTITTLTQQSIYEHKSDDYRAARTRSLNAHEMAHQWFGDYVTCKDWSHLWLNESFATFYANLYEGHKFGRDALLYGLYLDARDEVLLPENANDLRPIVYREYDHPQEQFDFRNYPKGGWVLHMLRSLVGDELYRQAIHTYLQRHALSEVETEDLREIFEELSGRSLDQFFDQWIYHGGQPELTVKYEWDAERRLAHVSIEQTQATGDDVLLFQFPTKLRFVVDGKTIDESVDVTQKKQDFYVKLPGKPEIVRFDPEYTLLAKIKFEKSDALLEADLKNENDMMGRVLACEALAARRTGSAVAALKHALQHDKFFGVRQSAARALRQICSDEAVAALVGATDQDDVRARRTVVEELGKCYHDDARAKLLEIAADDDELASVAAAAIRALGRSSSKEARQAILGALESESFNNERVVAAFGAIRDLNDPTLAPALIKGIRRHVNDVDSREIGDGLMTLAMISPKGKRQARTFEFLADYLDSPREPLRLAAINALGQLHDGRARALLEPFTAEGQIDRSIAAAKRALATLDDRADFVPDEVSELRREVRELRASQTELKDSLDELQGKAKAGKSSSDDSSADAKRAENDDAGEK